MQVCGLDGLQAGVLLLLQSRSPSALESRGDWGRVFTTGGREVSHYHQKKALDGPGSFASVTRKKHGLSPFRRHGRRRRRWKKGHHEVTVIEECGCFL